MTSYETDVQPFLPAIEGWARDGLTETQIAENLKIGRATYFRYKKRYPELAARLKINKEVADYCVENALFKRAIGYTYTEKRTESSDKNGVTVTKTEKHVMPDVGAQAFWLKNRRSDKWKDRPPEDDGKVMEVLFQLLESINISMQLPTDDAKEGTTETTEDTFSNIDVEDLSE